MSTPRRPPAIARRLAKAVAVWALVWGLAVGAAVWLAASREVDELLDEALLSSAQLLAVLNAQALPPAQGDETGPAGLAGGPAGVEHFAWQLVDAQGRLHRHSPLAPDRPWHDAPTAGFSDLGGWRVYGQALGQDGLMLYAAQAREERAEARADVALGAVLAALTVGLLGQLWLRLRVRQELLPLQQLSERLAGWEVDAPQADAAGLPASLGPAQRQELVPVHQAIEQLASRLAGRIANERAFAAHAAHALRTPLAGIDAQLAVALRESPPALQPRLQKVRDAATRLQGVVAALLGLFRSGATLQRSAVDLPALLARLPVPALQVEVQVAGAGVAPLEADADLLAAALLNLLDNALRHGARRVQVQQLATPSGAPLIRLQDDGPGVTAARRAELREALAAQRYESLGLGLMLADRVARAHGGALGLPDCASGFTVELLLGPASGPLQSGPA